MPPIRYHNLGPAKLLHDIVFAGSHDAGITQGAANVRTQSHNLFEQAGHGIRFFDMRIAASTVVIDGERFAEMRTFHSGITTEKKKSATVLGLQNAANLQVKRSKLLGGDWGEGLTGLLHQAGRFVSDAASNSEFLILKFDKSTNWVPIARQCEEELGNLLYSQSGNLNTTPIGNLAGRVIVLFPTSGIAAIAGEPLSVRQRIHGWKNLKAEGTTYQPAFDGLQYFGKGGTSATNGASMASKITENEKKQKKLMGQAEVAREQSRTFGRLSGPKQYDPPVPPETLGMMYWTTTGLLASIEDRTAGMWDNPGQTRLKKVWANGMSDYLSGILHADVASTPLTDRAKQLAGGATARRFMPNIVMVDFADRMKCDTIYGLNSVTAFDLARLV